jgi:hypothetical protein
MKWSETYISFDPDDHPKTDLSDRNLPFVVKLPIGKHKVDRTLIDNGARMNLIMCHTFIKMELKLGDLQPIRDTFHSVIPFLSSTPLGKIDLTVVCGFGDNKHRETLTFKVANFNMGYNCILGRPFLIKFMAVILMAYKVMKMPGRRGSSPSNPMPKRHCHATSAH